MPARPQPAAGTSSPVSLYDWPQYWDILFRDETRREVAFLEAAFRKYVPFPVRRVLEAGCGSGRLVAALARRGYCVWAFDRSRTALEYAARKLARRRLSAHLFPADLARFRLPVPVHAAVCTFNTFRHLLCDTDARSHLEAVAQALVPGGIYVLGLHLLPDDVAADSCERWRARHGRTRLTATLRVVRFDRRRRRERLRLDLVVRSPRRTQRLSDHLDLRLYTPRQFRRLLAQVPALELLDAFDFWYDLSRPRRLDDRCVDTVVVLRKRPAG
jgi:SAM-dependent methyltransferase